MFRMFGKRVQLIRYIVTWEETAMRGIDGEENKQEMQERCISEEHKNVIEQRLIGKEISFVTTPVNQTENEWFDGLEFNSYDEAMETFTNGEQKYLQEKSRQELANNLKLRADVDYLAIMMEVEI